MVKGKKRWKKIRSSACGGFGALSVLETPPSSSLSSSSKVESIIEKRRCFTPSGAVIKLSLAHGAVNKILLPSPDSSEEGLPWSSSRSDLSFLPSVVAAAVHKKVAPRKKVKPLATQARTTRFMTPGERAKVRDLSLARPFRRSRD